MYIILKMPKLTGKQFFNMKTTLAGLALLFLAAAGCSTQQQNLADFPAEMVSFKPFENNPVFSGTDTDTWDTHIRERGFILYEEGFYNMWYSGYSGGDNSVKHLGYATSTDGINWTRYPGNPVFDKKWTEDMFVIKSGETYYMYAEGENDIAHMLTSSDGIHWEAQGDLIILETGGDTISAPYGTPTVWIEDGKWYLFYERNDLGIWLATSNDKITWTNIQDKPVLEMGPEVYDSGAVAANQVVKYNNKYYLYYHGSTNPNWANPEENALWTSNVAMSTDLINWKKYPGNPLVDGDTSSPILVFDGEKYRLYTMHDKVGLYFPK
jgi:beta-1,2-mannobiose phosphorylase / 1,2-beta-oligomannan phosphorylase